MSPQEALETAVLNSIAANLAYNAGETGRTFDGRPPAACGERFVAVWSDCMRTSDSRTSLDNRYTVSVTETIRLQRYPADKWVLVRDKLIEDMDAIIALIHRDSLDHHVINQANVIANRGEEATRRVGFSEALMCTGLDRWQLVSGAWFRSKEQTEAGVMITASFGKARLIQGIRRAG